MKQIMEAVYTPAADASMTEPFEALFRLAEVPLNMVAGASSEKLSENSARFQARAFVAVVTYLLERNGYTPAALDACLSTVNHPSPAAGMTAADVAWHRLRDVLTTPDAWAVRGSALCVFERNDAVKFTSAMTGMARAVDLYLGLENARAHWND